MMEIFLAATEIVFLIVFDYFENNRYKMHSVILIISEIENNKKVNQNLTTIILR